MTSNGSNKLFEILGDLAAANISYSLSITREGAVTILAAVPGERWEIDVYESGDLDFEVFQSDGTIHNEVSLEDRLSRFRD